MDKEEKLVWIKKVEKKGTKYLVYTDLDDDPIKLTEELVVNYRIVKGNSFYLKDWNKIKKSIDEGMLLDKVLSYIDYKMRTEREVLEYLEEKGANQKEKENIIKKLKQVKMVDDDRYTKMYIESELNHLSGPRLIEYNLKNKGISEELIKKYLSDISIDTYIENGTKVANSTLKSNIGQPVNKQKEIIYSKLSRMGYTISMVNQISSMVSYYEVDLDKLKELYNKLLDKEEDKNKIIQKLMSKGYDYQDIKKVMN